MAKIVIPGSARKCVFCKYWSGGYGVATRSKNRGYWDVESGANGNCNFKHGQSMPSHAVACSNFVKDDYKYPDI